MLPDSQRSLTPKGRAARHRILRAAEKLLAARGFHGTSVRDVAEAARVPLASAIYHFARKEQLYGAVLADIANDVDARLAAVPSSEDYIEQLDALLEALLDWAEARPGRVRLLLRELLDNPVRVQRASRLPLAPVLARLTAFVARGIAEGRLRLAGSPEIAVLHMVGALSYVVAARPTLHRIVGETRARTLDEGYRAEAMIFARRAVGAQ